MTQFSTISSEVKNIVWNFFNTVRSEKFFSAPHKTLMVSLYATSKRANTKILDILSSFKVDLTRFLSDTEIDRLISEYKNVIYYCFEQIGKEQNRMLDDVTFSTYLPDSLVELCGILANVKENSSVYLPYCGDGSFARICEKCDVYGFEKNQESWAISQIILSIITDNSDVVLCGDHSHLKNNQKFDYIFAYPPFFQGNEGKEIVETLRQLITERLNENGEFYAILPQNYCFASNWIDLRKIVSDNDEFSTMVITLPAMLAPITNISLCLVHCTRNHKGLVVLADTSNNEFFAKHDVAGHKQNVLKVQSVFETVTQRDEKHVWIGKAVDIPNSLNLTPARYLISQNIPQAPSGYKYYKLKELITLIPLGKESKNTNETPLLGMKQLSFSYLNCDVMLKNIPTKVAQNTRLLYEDALLVGFISGKFKVGRIWGLSKTRYVSIRHEVFAIKLTSDLITEDYLLHCILSELTENQGKGLAVGTVTTLLKQEDLLAISIAVPSLEEQKKICKADTKKSLSESDKQLLDSYEEFRQDMHMKKHSIGQTIFNLNNWWKILQKARKEGNGVLLDTAKVGKSHPVSVSCIFDNLQEAIYQLQQQISKFDRGNGLEIKKIALTEFIEEYVKTKQSPLFRYIYDKTKHRASQNVPEIIFNEETGEMIDTKEMILNEGDPIEYVDFAPEALTMIFDNIISNACSHGFAGKESNNLIKIDFTAEGDDLVLTISNNGKPVHKQISEKDVFTYGKTSQNGRNHFGIGGYEIRKLMREFNGDAFFITDPNSEFPVTYKLIFHSTNITTISL